MFSFESWTWLLSCTLTLFAATIVHTALKWFDVYPNPPGKSRPQLSLKGHLLNLILWPHQKLQRRKEFQPLSLEVLERESIEKVGYSNFGSKDYETPFRETMEFINREGYSPLGFVAVREFFKNRLITKLRLMQELNKPEIQSYVKSNPLRTPVFIVGMPRTGTTFLHRLLDLDPAARAPCFWELPDVVPRVRDDPVKDRKKRLAFWQNQLDFVHSVIPQLSDYHDIGADDPEECNVSMSQDIPISAVTFAILLRNQHKSIGYVRNSVGAFENYSKVLQLLSYYEQQEKGSARRWVMKNPPHLLSLDVIAKVFPDARIVWTHRALKEVMPSYIGFMRCFDDLTNPTGTINLHELGDNCMHYATRNIEEGDKFFNNVTKIAPDTKTTNLKYKDLISDPVTAVEKLYNDFGFDFTDEYRQILEDYIRKDKEKRRMTSKKRKVRDISLEKFGLDESDLREKLGWYTDKYLLGVNANVEEKKEE